MCPAVKPPRAYDASGRRRAAAQRRDRVLAAAHRGFLEDGFVSTTVAGVSEAAGVSPEFVYKAFGSKAGLARAVWERALEGQGDRPAEERSDAGSAAAPDARAILRNWATLSAEVSELGAPLLVVLRAAALVDDAAAELLVELEESRSERMTHNATHLLRHGELRPGLGPTEVRDVLLHAAGELYEAFVLRRGWGVEAYVELTYRFLESALLRP